MSADAIRLGVRQARLHGRFEIASERPRVILDVAHNPQAMAGLAGNLEAMPCAGKTLAVVGMLADKDYRWCACRAGGKS